MQPPPIAHPDVPKKRNNTALWIVLIVALGGGCVILMMVLAAILVPVFSQARTAAQRTQKLSAVKEVTRAYSVYLADWDDTFPVSEELTTVEEYLDTPANDPGFTGISFHKKLAGKSIVSIESPDKAILVYYGSNETLETYLERRFVGFADGSAKALRPGDSDPSFEVKFAGK